MEKELDSNNESGEITQVVKLMSTKKENEADMKFFISNNSDNAVQFINVPKDTNITHPFIASEAVKYIKESLILSYGDDYGFNIRTFTNFCADNNIKEQQNYCYPMKMGKSVRYKYSQDLVNYIVYMYATKQHEKD